MASQIETIHEALKSIIKKRRAVLAALHDRHGWEKWLQVELAFALREFGEPEFESAYTYDQRRVKPKSKKDNNQAFIDLQFRGTNHLKGKFTAIEIKVNESEKGLGPLLSDLIKIDAIVTKEWNFRSVVAILAHGNLTENNTKFTRLRQDLLEQEISRKPIVAKTDGAGFEFIVIGWERSRTQYMTHQSYSDWLWKLLGLCEKHGVFRRTARKRDLD